MKPSDSRTIKTYALRRNTGCKPVPQRHACGVPRARRFNKEARFQSEPRPWGSGNRTTTWERKARQSISMQPILKA